MSEYFKTDERTALEILAQFCDSAVKLSESESRQAWHKLNHISYSEQSDETVAWHYLRAALYTRNLEEVYSSFEGRPWFYSCCETTLGEFERVKRLDLGVQMMQVLLTHDPEDEDLKYELAVVLRKSGRCQESLVILDGMIASGATSHDIFYAKGNVLRSLERFNEAVVCFERASALEPDDTDVLNNLGLTYFEVGDLEKASQILHQAYQLNPVDPVICRNIGTVSQAKGDDQKALRFFEKTLQLDSTFVEVFGFMADIYHRRGESGIATQLRSLASNSSRYGI